MAKNAVSVGADQKNEPGVTTTTTFVPGVGNVEVYVKVEHVDDLDQRPSEGIRAVQIRFPVEKEEEVVAKGEDGEPLKNEDGSDKLTTQKYIGYEMRELDLSPANFTKLQKALKPYYDASREIEAPIRVAAPSGPSTALTEWSGRCREWLRASPETPVKMSEKVPVKGRIRGEWEAAFIQATGDKKPE